MATGGSDLWERVQGRLLECPICQESYQAQGRSPRVLPCHHALCGACLDRLRQSGPFPCPICRGPVSVQEFPTETTRMTLLELVSVATERCGQHKKELEFSCADCQTFLCSKCAVLLHRDHRLEDLEPLMQEKRKQVLEMGKEMEAILPKIQTRARRSKATVESLIRRKEQAAAEIRAMFAEVATQVKARETHALKALQARFEADKRMLEAENQQEQTLLDEARTLVQTSRSLGHEGTPTQLTSQVPHLQQSCSQLQERAVLDQQAAPVYQVELGAIEDLPRVLETVGSISVLPRQTMEVQTQQMLTSLEAQKEKVCHLLNKILTKGDTWYLVDMGWFKQWKKYVGFDSWDTYSLGEEAAHPGCIDNSALFKSEGSGHFREGLIDDLDYVLLPEEAWLDLEAWYGLVDDSHCIARKVREQGMFIKHCKVEVYLLELKLYQHSDPRAFVHKKFSRVDTVGKLEETMRDVFKIPPNTEVRLWNRYMNNDFVHLNQPEKSLQDAGLYQGQVIIIEQRNADGSWPGQIRLM